VLQAAAAADTEGKTFERLLSDARIEKDRELPSGESDAAQSIESMEQCIAWKTHIEPELERWLSKVAAGEKTQRRRVRLIPFWQWRAVLVCS